VPQKKNLCGVGGGWWGKKSFWKLKSSRKKGKRQYKEGQVLHQEFSRSGVRKWLFCVFAPSCRGGTPTSMGGAGKEDTIEIGGVFAKTETEKRSYNNKPPPTPPHTTTQEVGGWVRSRGSAQVTSRGGPHRTTSPMGERANTLNPLLWVGGWWCFVDVSCGTR